MNTEQKPFILTEEGIDGYNINIKKVKELLENPIFKLYQGIFKVNKAVSEAVERGQASQELENLVIQNLFGEGVMSLLDVLKEKGYTSAECSAAKMIDRGELALPQNPSAKIE